VQFKEVDNFRPSNYISHIVNEKEINPQNVFVATRATLAKQNLLNPQTTDINENELEVPNIILQKKT